jgi:predicted  nucleic acid-binding Zn-ribbon protein
MSERDRLQREIRSLESIEQGLRSNISDYQQRIISAQRDRADAGRHTDALERQRAADRRIRDLESSIQSAKREIDRVRNQIKGLKSEIASWR